MWRVMGAVVVTLGAWTVLVGALGGLLDNDIILMAAILPILVAIAAGLVVVAVMAWQDVFRGRP